MLFDITVFVSDINISHVLSNIGVWGLVTWQPFLQKCSGCIVHFYFFKFKWLNFVSVWFGGHLLLIRRLESAASWSGISLWWPLILNIAIHPNLRSFHPYQDISSPSKDLITWDSLRCKGLIITVPGSMSQSAFAYSDVAGWVIKAILFHFWNNEPMFFQRRSCLLQGTTWKKMLLYVQRWQSLACTCNVDIQDRLY